MKKILVINGPNLNMLGIREPGIYGELNYDSLVEFIREKADALGLETDFFQSNCEGAIVDRIQQAYKKYDAIIINPAAYTHTSIAILDALKAVGLPTVEVHLSDIGSREEFRRISYVSLYALKTIKGKSFEGYADALEFLSKQPY
ncbi:MAG: type II 3-dehydroquinate dehydratase [Bacteroidales bacterium]|jgi:3-dehydroquinate dehydratase-2|nr:type II 3-dehydroquinate dehydratase [Bacteroidales bacterium]